MIIRDRTVGLLCSSKGEISRSIYTYPILLVAKPFGNIIKHLSAPASGGYKRESGYSDVMYLAVERFGFPLSLQISPSGR